MNKTFEQDLSLIMGQQEQVAYTGSHLKDLYLPLKTSDLFAIEYRKWLDRFGRALPFYQGYATAKSGVESSTHLELLSDHNSRHTYLCHSCQQAHQTTIWLKQSLIAIAILLAAWAMAIAPTAPTAQQTYTAVLVSLLATFLATLAHQFKIKFEQ